MYSLPLAAKDSLLTGKLKAKLAELGQFVYDSWDTTCCVRDNPGGAWWNTQHTYKATASNAGAANAMAALYDGLGNSTLLVRGQLIFEYWRLNQVLDSGQVLVV